MKALSFSLFVLSLSNGSNQTPSSVTRPYDWGCQKALVGAGLA